MSAREANQHFTKLLRRAERGEEVTITKRGKAGAKLVPPTTGQRTADTDALRDREDRSSVA